VKGSARNEVLNPCAPEFILRRSPENFKKEIKKKAATSEGRHAAEEQ